MNPLFEIPGRSIARSTWCESWHGASASGVEVYTAAGLRAARHQPAAADPESPHYYGARGVCKVYLPGDVSDAEVEAVCEREFAARCLAWKELHFMANLVFVPDGPAPRLPRTGDCLQVFGFVGTVLELEPVGEARAEYRVRVEW